MFRVSNPGLMLRSLSRVRSSRPAPVSTTIDSATCSTTRLLPPAKRFIVLVRELAFRSEETLAPALRMAGNAPKHMPASKVTTTVNSRTVRASAAPRAAPINDNSRLSVNNCRMTRPRPAPSARRTAISVERDVPRASRRPATFAHAISSTAPTAAMSRTSGLPNRSRMPSSPLCAGNRARLGLSSLFHACFVPCNASLTNSKLSAVCAWLLETSGRSRASTVSHQEAASNWPLQ